MSEQPQWLDSPPRPMAARFLASGATTAQLLGATARNHSAWFAANARAAGGETGRINSAAWTYTPGPSGEVVIPFPRLARADADAMLDALLAVCRSRDVNQVSCWTVTVARPADLGARLAARGFEWGWKPHWMALDLSNIRADFPVPGALKIAVDDIAEWDASDLPYHNRDDAARLHILAQARPRRTWHFGAWLNGAIVGHCVLFVTTGAVGVAGIYNVGVVPAARNQGVGRAVTLAACRFAQSLGCHYATLNSATHIYDRLGFQSLGHGQTWWMHRPALQAPPPTPDQVAFVEAVARGDVRALNAINLKFLPASFDAPLPNGMTPAALAVSAGKPASVEWLVTKGATLDVLQAWDLGWKARAAQMLSCNPELVNRRTGAWQITPLHEAVQRNDIELARFCLAAQPDLAAQDSAFHSTPLGWARHLGRPEIAALIEAQQAAPAMPDTAPAALPNTLP